MIKIVTAGSFFSANIPAIIPDDTATPNWKRLINRADMLDASSYPLESLKTILSRENDRIGADGKLLETIDTVDNDTMFVLSGQQAGLFGGPLYTFYKAMHSIRLASRISESSGKNVLPLFWIASDDHDFDEVKDLGIRTQNGSEFRIEYKPKSYHEGMPVGDILIDDDIHEVIDLYEKNIFSGDRTQKYIEIIRNSWQPGTSWVNAFSAQMVAMCSSYGLIIIDPRWQGIKKLYAHIMTEELNNPLVSTGLINTEADTFENSRKRRKALKKPADSTNLFVEFEGVRYPVRFDGTGFIAGSLRYSRTQILDMLRTSPELFSPGAALRPVCQDFMLPVVATIGGPGERIYLSQIQPLYDFFNINASVVWPRASFTIIDKRITRTAEKEGIELEKLFETPEKIRAELAYDSFPENIMEKFDSLENALKHGFDGLADSITALDSTLVQSVDKEKGKAIHMLEGLKERAIRAHKNSVNITDNRFTSAANYLRPSGGPQERWFGADVVYSNFGEENFKEFIKLTSPGEEHHRLIFPED
ncbi:MAG: bacillithiol biosynthesis cysteine-adding enzyme BshC [Candidatus Latescibacteria bacterium]|nr:bacillithiol biosynthesis cysteine-adding enzyme BshC [Candidatus Latescibacterota bacterium]